MDHKTEYQCRVDAVRDVLAEELRQPGRNISEAIGLSDRIVDSVVETIAESFDTSDTLLGELVGMRIRQRFKSSYPQHETGVTP